MQLYLSHVLANMKDEPGDIRPQAGLALKNQVAKGYAKLKEDQRVLVKTHVINTVGDPSQFVRNTVASVGSLAA